MHQLNEDIRDSEIRLIGSTGEQLGIMSAAQAQRIADEQGLDLVKISPQATPPKDFYPNTPTSFFSQNIGLIKE